MSRLFGVSKGTIKWHCKTDVARATKHYANGRPRILTCEEHNDLISFIAAADANKHALMMHDIVHHITERYGEAVDANSIRHMFSRDPGAESCRSVPMEEKCLRLTAEDITADFARRTAAIEGAPANFVYNMDELGHQEWTDRQE
jgi:hypothetical protein